MKSSLLSWLKLRVIILNNLLGSGSRRECLALLCRIVSLVRHGTFPECTDLGRPVGVLSSSIGLAFACHSAYVVRLRLVESVTKIISGSSGQC